LGIYVMEVREHIRHEIGGFKVLYSSWWNMWCQKKIKWMWFLDLSTKMMLQERFFKLIHVRNTKSLTLKWELCALKSKHAFDVQNLYGQRYDMQATWRGNLIASLQNVSG
jgi:hypothetical protein